MYIYLDESYNLKDRTKKQFISINGFETTAIKRIWKRWKTYRSDFISNTFYKQYIGQKNEDLEKLKIKTIQIKNPLK